MGYGDIKKSDFPDHMTAEKIITHPPNDAYRQGYDRIFGKKKRGVKRGKNKTGLSTGCNTEHDRR